MRYGIRSHSFYHTGHYLNNQDCNVWKSHKILQILCLIRDYCYGVKSNPKLNDLIRNHTVVTSDHLTPEIKLHLITSKCDAWNMKEEDLPFKNPYWAFYWPGGQALARFILDNPTFVQKRTVLDFGCGSGACAIAAALSGAKTVIANDIDPVACTAARLNAEINKTIIFTQSENLVGKSAQWDCILIGDVFYDDDFTSVLCSWLRHVRNQDSLILIGDVGRLSFKNIQAQENLALLAEIQLPEEVKNQNNGFTSAKIWSLI